MALGKASRPEVVAMAFLPRVLAAALLLASIAPARADVQHETIVFVRHGEKPPGGLGQLECKGLNRSLALPPVLLKQFGTPDFIFAPDPGKQILEDGHTYNYIRPLATIEPTAIRLGKPVNTNIGYNDLAGLQHELLKPPYQNSLLFVAWEHLRIVKIVRNMMQQAGADPSVVPDWSEDNFDSIYVLHYDRDGKKVTVSFTQGQEGLNGQSMTCP
jgi:hypothetical protein